MAIDLKIHGLKLQWEYDPTTAQGGFEHLSDPKNLFELFGKRALSYEHLA